MDNQKYFGKPDKINIDLIIKHLEEINNAFGGLNHGSSFELKSDSLEKDNFVKDIGKRENTKKAYKKLRKYFSGTPNWNSPTNMFNITPPPLIHSVAVKTIAGLINPNLVMDSTSGNLVNLEYSIAKYIGSLVGWNDASGIFTYGGTGTNMYGAKIGINKCSPQTIKKGIHNIIIIDSDLAHSSHSVVADWLGVGLKNNMVMGTNKNGEIDINQLEKLIDKQIKKGKIIGCINLNGGNTYDFLIDNIQKISKLVKKIVKKYDLNYCPHIHVDSVIGWVFLVFEGYDFSKNPLNIQKDVIKIIKYNYNKIKKLKYADSFGVDFHKSGFCPYVSSLFVLKNKRDWVFISRGAKDAHHQAFELARHSPGKYTLETSRSAEGPLTAYILFKTLGLNGIRKILGDLLSVANYGRKKLHKSKYFQIANMHSKSWVIMILYNPLLLDIFNLNDNEKEKFDSELKKFYDFFMSKNKKWLVSFSKKYRINKKTTLSAIKVYPMSPHIKTKHMKEFVDDLDKAGEEYYKRCYTKK